jgi:predicted HAD superfamily Cof-like phosphohydrolase
VHEPQIDVIEFHTALDIPVGSVIGISRGDLRARLIGEEARETNYAIWNNDLVGAIDGLCDLLCVVYGTAVEFGIDLAPFWKEVHRSNMAKVGGPVRADGKVLKPDGWTPPDIEGILGKQYAAQIQRETHRALTP